MQKILGFLISCCPAVNYGYLYTKISEREKYLALRENNGSYDAKMYINSFIIEELNWLKKLNSKSRNPTRNTTYDLEIYTDASLSGWGLSVREKRSTVNRRKIKRIFLSINLNC